MSATSISIGADRTLVARVEELSGQNVFSCYQCGRCTATCPFSFNPQQVLRKVQLGQVVEAAGLETTWRCASCFSCVVACPKGVDPPRVMRALRAMAARGDLGRRHRKGHRARSRLIAANHETARIGSRLAPASNWALRAPGAGLATEIALGIERSRRMPEFSRPSFESWFSRHQPPGDGHRGPVLLFVDTYMDFNFPGIGIAATDLLERAGFAVSLARNSCCGRPMISKGYLEMAARQARANLEILLPAARKGLPVVGCEPSCLLTFHREYPDLLAGDGLEAEANEVAAQVVSIDTFLDSLRDSGQLELAFDPAKAGGKPVIFHGHCHQKAFSDPEAGLRLLRAAGFDAELANASCCGMAGSFGYEKENRELSEQAWKRGLLPAIEGNPGAELVVMGISCRQQAEHFTSQRPKHLVEVLRDVLADSRPRD